MLWIMPSWSKEQWILLWRWSDYCALSRAVALQASPLRRLGFCFRVIAKNPWLQWLPFWTFPGCSWLFLDCLRRLLIDNSFGLDSSRRTIFTIAWLIAKSWLQISESIICRIFVWSVSSLRNTVQARLYAYATEYGCRLKVRRTAPLGRGIHNSEYRHFVVNLDCGKLEQCTYQYLP